ncbi:MAG: response regulator [Acidobacteria bacterium]|nr:response regulator [Acidobacteriota bacterium]
MHNPAFHQAVATPKVLVADNEPLVVALLKSFLERKGYGVVTASRGNEALEKFKDEHPQIVLIEARLPSPSGLDVLRQIKQLSQSVGVIVVTTAADDRVGSAALEKGAFDYISKPFDLRYLEGALCRMLQQQPQVTQAM